MLATVLARKRRQLRTRARISGTAERPRLNVYKSNAFIYAQLIDDVTGATICAASDLKLTKGTKSERAAEVGQAVAKLAQEKGVSSVVFDRAGFAYMGRVQALADAARSAGLKF